MTELERLDLTVSEVLNSSNGRPAGGREIGEEPLVQGFVTGPYLALYPVPHWVGPAIEKGARAMRRPEFVARHGRRPEGWFGRLLATLMAWETRKENNAALKLLDIHAGDRVLEIGFGHGRSIAAAAELTRGGLVAGIDFSPAMVAMARRRNRALVEMGLVDLREGDSLHLPFEDESFDGAFSVHTVYFWATPIAHMQEVRRVLKSRGRFVLGLRPESEQARRDFPPSVYQFRSAEQIRQMLLSAGFRSVGLVDGGGAARGVMFGVASYVGDTPQIILQQREPAAGRCASGCAESSRP